VFQVIFFHFHLEVSFIKLVLLGFTNGEVVAEVANHLSLFFLHGVQRPLQILFFTSCKRELRVFVLNDEIEFRQLSHEYSMSLLNLLVVFADGFVEGLVCSELHSRNSVIRLYDCRLQLGYFEVARCQRVF
jgi:hypothetical protein